MEPEPPLDRPEVVPACPPDGPGLVTVFTVVGDPDPPGLGVAVAVGVECGGGTTTASTVSLVLPSADANSSSPPNDAVTV